MDDLIPSVQIESAEWAVALALADANTLARHSEANARLIAAAPDLATAVESLLPWVEEWQQISDYPPGKAKMKVAISTAHAALARARGEVLT